MEDTGVEVTLPEWGTYYLTEEQWEDLRDNYDFCGVLSGRLTFVWFLLDNPDIKPRPTTGMTDEEKEEA